MKCPYCGNTDTKVIDSRSMDDGTAIRRRRLCEKCGERVTTYERIEALPLVVIKRNGTREPFDKTKLVNGIVKSCNKRPVTMEQMDSITYDIETTIFNSTSKEISSQEIGEMVMLKLKEFDEVAYVRFASVYRQFKDVDTFVAELSKLLREKKSFPVSEEPQNEE